MATLTPDSHDAPPDGHVTLQTFQQLMRCSDAELRLLRQNPRLRARGYVELAVADAVLKGTRQGRQQALRELGR